MSFGNIQNLLEDLRYYSKSGLDENGWSSNWMYTKSTTDENHHVSIHKSALDQELITIEKGGNTSQFVVDDNSCRDLLFIVWILEI